MERSLSVILPVHNAQATISATVTETLEAVADLTGQFELVIVDDGSVDATSEVVDELIRAYPQVNSVRHGAHLGHSAAVRSGLKHSKGEIIVLHDPAAGEAQGGYQMAGRQTMERIHGASRPARPNYLSRLREFAMGE